MDMKPEIKCKITDLLKDYDENIPDKLIDSLNDHLSNGHDEFYCIYFDGNIAGFISFQSNIGRLKMLYIDDAYRRKGLATLALNKFETESYKRNKKEIRAFVNKKNAEGINLYKKIWICY